MIKSSLTDVVRLTTNFNSRPEWCKITRITPHCVVGQFKAEEVASWDKFKSGGKASANYIIGRDGELLLNVAEEHRAWTSGTRSTNIAEPNYNDYGAITIECASGNKYPYEFNDAVFNKLILLCADICRRYDKNKLVWLPDKAEALKYEATHPDDMIITIHRWFENVKCCGQWLIDKMPELVLKVNDLLGYPLTTETLYCVQVGAFAHKENADRLKQELIKKGYYDAFIVEKRRS